MCCTGNNRHISERNLRIDIYIYIYYLYFIEQYDLQPSEIFLELSPRHDILSK